VMQRFAAIELLLFQNKSDQALIALDSMLVSYPGHSITDEIYWLQSKIYMEQGNFDRSITLLHKIEQEYKYDILSDDAYFLIGEIYEKHLYQKDQAMEVYQDFLTRYPGSIYTSEARKRFRKLRGDIP